MGRDIFHVFQRLDGKLWIPVECEYSGNRDYDLFDWLGLGDGDRWQTCSYAPIAPLRGLPPGFSIGRRGL